MKPIQALVRTALALLSILGCLLLGGCAADAALARKEAKWRNEVEKSKADVGRATSESMTAAAAAAKAHLMGGDTGKADTFAAMKALEFKLAVEHLSSATKEYQNAQKAAQDDRRIGHELIGDTMEAVLANTRQHGTSALTAGGGGHFTAPVVAPVATTACPPTHMH